MPTPSKPKTRRNRAVQGSRVSPLCNRKLKQGSGPNIEVCILAGGLSSRMGTNKAALTFRGLTFVQHLKLTARQTGLPTVVLKKDAVARCGPLGGIFTQLRKTKFQAVLFLACDMPLVSAPLLEYVVSKWQTDNFPVFIPGRAGWGFPLLLNKSNISQIKGQIEKKAYSLQKLAEVFEVKKWKLPSRFSKDLANLNTPSDWSKFISTAQDMESKPECGNHPL